MEDYFKATVPQPVNPDKLIVELARDEYVVDKVIDKKMVKGKITYLVTWLGHTDQTWQSPQESFQGAIDKYENSIKGKNK